MEGVEDSGRPSLSSTREGSRIQVGHPLSSTREGGDARRFRRLRPLPHTVLSYHLLPERGGGANPAAQGPRIEPNAGTRDGASSLDAGNAAGTIQKRRCSCLATMTDRGVQIGFRGGCLHRQRVCSPGGLGSGHCGRRIIRPRPAPRRRFLISSTTSFSHREPVISGGQLSKREAVNVALAVLLSTGSC